MKIAVLKETAEYEARVATTPETVKKLIAKGFEIYVVSGAGLPASYIDSEFEAAGATLSADNDKAAKDADIVLCVQSPATLPKMKKDALLIGMLSPYGDTQRISAYAQAQITALSMELVPRITRAQAMDVLSSQSNLAGYKAVLDAATYYTRAFPMMMTAAGTIAPARVFVMGAGVAGLQAIATAKRLGAIVSATDVRPAAKEQVQSLGASFVMVESDEMKQAETAGGYAKEMSDDFKRKQATLVAETIVKQDIVITTALIPGRPAPVLVTEDMVKSMKAGSIIIDLAVEQGGNCTLSKPGEIVDVNGVKIIGFHNMPSRIATDASALYSRNLLNFLGILVDKDGALALDMEDDIVKATTLTKDGQIIHPNFQ
ncbi:MAG TPA: Re/Si-specific NAD(P)(+) transhydrogenase subunit alpha [Alphaproteobacteria bacterium]|nr:Re/Si-specific NAD(P)(+) transhydrogenase subunit alpha [Alphaproteobacteria bacterium]MCB9985205.1 Re/Si-specific NAD(P)(+) transhydrogenase subunit alpha [Micavibrio sp.]HPQ51100.1 Re/Si-specific NAD(P)(+) transhydrogenase subunit alpha [Alphaproteobacteria bacterium]HRK98092.1 Re/Si-specific NAD(P)(+) transhydrogenase subunit alpha [Alphaproteobacteria bacterium]